jgi:hypothetical protein
MARIKMTATARVVLFLLKFYLVFLFILIIVKFVKTVR